MKFIIHIGTHKTGSSSIQNCLMANRAELARRGVWYVAGPESPRNVNFVGNHLALGRDSEVGQFLVRTSEAAARRGCHKVVLSGESLYAMTAFFHLFQGERLRDYWERERANVKRLHTLLPEGDVQITCYVRPQDMFLESLYNQMVKQPHGIPWSIHEFAACMEPMLDYYRHLRVWADTFGRENLRVCAYDAVRTQLATDFLVRSLELSEPIGFTRPMGAVNTRLHLDVMEVKRILNRRTMSAADEFMTYRAVIAVSAEMGDSDPMTLLAPETRADLFDRWAESNARLREYFLRGAGSDPLTSGHGVAEKVYPGLTPERAVEVLGRMDRTMRRPRLRLERAARTVIHRTQCSLPWVQRLLRPLRRLHYRRFVERERKGLHWS